MENTDTPRAIRWWLIPALLAHLSRVGLIAVLLWDLPVLSVGWFQIMSGRPGGNALLGQLDGEDAIAQVLAIALPLFVAAAVPAEARSEAELFRDGTPHRKPAKRGLVTAGFGLIRLWMGVPGRPASP